jgi:dTDP-4-amino-4,6-dideoxygalactose transaminase
MIPVSKPFIGEEEKQAVMAVLESGMLAQGPRTAELEEKFADLCGVKHAVATTSGTTALHVALLAHDIGPGDEVITTPFTFIASANSVLFTGAKPVFVDIEPDTFNIDPALIEQAITSGTKAIMPVHLFGHMCDMESITHIADKHNLVIIEDACQAVNATFNGQKAGSFGTGCFSLYATKNLMSGEGGMITTNDAAVAEKCRMLRNHGMKRRYHHDMLGYNFRLSDLHAAIGLAQINRINDFTVTRQSNAAYLNAHITGSIIKPMAKPSYEHVWHQYTIRVQNGRDEMVNQLNANGVGTGIFYPIPAHKHEYMQKIVGDVSLPVAEQIATEVISLPVHPQLTQVDLEKIVNEVNKSC